MRSRFLHFAPLLLLTAFLRPAAAQVSAPPVVSGTPAPPSPTTGNDPTAPTIRPDVFTNLPGPVASGSTGKAVGSVQSANATTPFTVEALELKRGANGRTVLKLALTNNSNGLLDAAGQFTAGLTDAGDPRQISGVYLVDPKSQQRFAVVRESQTQALCSKVDPALNPGERRPLDAQFPELPAGVTSVYVYFPHAGPIAGVPVTP